MHNAVYLRYNEVNNSETGTHKDVFGANAIKNIPKICTSINKKETIYNNKRLEANSQVKTIT